MTQIQVVHLRAPGCQGLPGRQESAGTEEPSPADAVLSTSSLQSRQGENLCRFEPPCLWGCQSSQGMWLPDGPSWGLESGAHGGNEPAHAEGKAMGRPSAPRHARHVDVPLTPQSSRVCSWSGSDSEPPATHQYHGHLVSFCNNLLWKINSKELAMLEHLVAPGPFS